MKLSLIFSGLVISHFSIVHASDDIHLYNEFPTLANAVKRFESKRNIVSKKFTAAVDKAIISVNNDNTLTEAAKSERVNEFNRAKTNFKTREALPTDDTLIPVSAAYLDNLYKREALNVKKQFERLQKDHQGDSGMLAKVNSLERRWLASLPTGLGYERNGDWYGRKTYTKGNAIDCNFHIREYANGIIGGSIWWNNRSSSQQAMEVKGRYFGNNLILETVKSLKGGPHQDYMKGYHIGDQILLEVKGRKGNTYAKMTFKLKIR